MSELDYLESISQNFAYSDGVMASSIAYCFKIFQRYIRPGSLLELGPAEGLMTDLLVRTSANVTVVEGSKKYCDEIAARLPDVQVVNSLFEDYKPETLFDNIVLGHVLEHVTDPEALLRRVKTWLADGGRILAAVPNARSLHRQAAVAMGLLQSEDTLNESDIHHGHRRVFSPEGFRNVFYQAGLDMEVFGGYWLKPLSNGQVEATWTPPMIDAFMRLGERYPDVSGEIYVIASKEVKTVS